MIGAIISYLPQMIGGHTCPACPACPGAPWSALGRALERAVDLFEHIGPK